MGWLEDLQEAAEDFVERTGNGLRGISWGEDDAPVPNAQADRRARARYIADQANRGLDRARASRQTEEAVIDLKVLPSHIATLGMTEQQWKRLPDGVKRMLITFGEDNAFGDVGQYTSGVEDLNSLDLDMAEGLDTDNIAWRRKLLTVERGNELREKPGAKVSGREYIARINSMEPDELEAFQRQLWAGGFYGAVEGESEREPIWGAPDEPTIKAVKLLTYTTMRFKGKKSILDVLDMFTAKHDADGDGEPDGGGEDQPTVRLTNPDDIRGQARATSQQLIGRIDSGFVESQVGDFQSQERAGQVAFNNDQRGGGGGTVTDEASLQGFTEEQMRRENDTEVDSYATLGAFNEMLRMLGMAG